ncbi:MAG: hypothetical protein L3J54_10315, partial [Draconibacterium sp.]|nr:hypothetical protein [Draconibacterium sp.]
MNLYLHVSKFFKREHCKHDLPVAFTQNKFLLILLIVLLSNISSVFGQVTIWSEDFNSYSDGTQQGSGTPPKWTINPTSGYGNHFEVRSSGSNILVQGRNMNQEGVFTSETIDISSFSNVVVSVDVSKLGNAGASDYVKLYYKIDGGTETLFETNGDNSGNFTSATATTNQLNGNSVTVVIRVYNNANPKRHRFDNVLVQGTPTSPPSCTTPISPADGLTGFAVDGSLTWNPVAGATGYYIHFGTDAAATNIENGTNLGNVTSYTPASDLSFLTDYYWKIVPYNGIGSASGCSVWSF